MTLEKFLCMTAVFLILVYIYMIIITWRDRKVFKQQLKLLITKRKIVEKYIKSYKCKEFEEYLKSENDKIKKDKEKL